MKKKRLSLLGENPELCDGLNDRDFYNMFKVYELLAMKQPAGLKTEEEDESLEDDYS